MLKNKSLRASQGACGEDSQADRAPSLYQGRGRQQRMGLSSRMQEKRREVIAAWYDHLLGTYQEVAAKAIRNNSDQFANPMGHTLTEAITTLYDELQKGMDSGKVAEALDDIIRIRSIQDFSASGAVGFIVALKGIMRKVLGESAGSAAEWRKVDDELDEMMLSAFDVYMDCRKAIYEIRAGEIKRQMHMLLRKAETAPQS